MSRVWTAEEAAAHEARMKAMHEERARDKRAEMCPHMLALVEFCEASRVFFGGCGDCGSAWLECKTCDKTVDEAHQVFP